MVGLYEQLVKRIPAKLNKVDYSIGCTCEIIRVERVLHMLGFGKQKRSDRTIFEDGNSTFELIEPREGWNPVLQLIK